MKKNKLKLTESGLKKLIKESTAKILKEMETENVPYEAWSEYLGGKSPMFEFEDGIIYVDYDENNGTLCSGHVTNNGFHKDGEVEVPVYDGNFLWKRFIANFHVITKDYVKTKDASLN